MSRLRRCAAAAPTGVRGFAAMLGMLVLAAGSAAAQPYQPAPHPGGIEIGGGAVWTGGYDAGRRNATESANSSTGGSPITLFTSSSRVPAVTGVDARAALYVGDRVAFEGLFQFARPNLRVTLDSDFENALPEDAVGAFSSYLFGGSVLYHFGDGRVVPFVLGGGGYLRLLDEDNAEVVTGNEAHAGGGVKIWFGTGATRLGLRLDAQVSARSKSPGFEEKRRMLPTFAAGLLYRF